MKTCDDGTLDQSQTMGDETSSLLFLFLTIYGLFSCSITSPDVCLFLTGRV